MGVTKSGWLTSRRLRPDVLGALAGRVAGVKGENMVKTHIRWMVRRHMEQVLDIEKGAFGFPWSEDEFVRCLRRRNCIGMVAEGSYGSGRVLGFMIYELHKTRLHILNFAVAAEARRHGVGSQMVDKLIGKLSCERRTRLLVTVRDTNLGAHLFLRQMGFRASGVACDYYENGDDAYCFEYLLKQCSAAEPLTN